MIEPNTPYPTLDFLRRDLKEFTVMVDEAKPTPESFKVIGRRLRKMADDFCGVLGGVAPDRQYEWGLCLPWSYDPGQGGSADDPEMPPHVGDADGLVLFDFVRREVRDETEGELWWVNWHVSFPHLVEALNSIGPNPAFDYAAAPPKPAPKGDGK